MDTLKKFIKLHTRADNAPVIINTDVINDITYDVVKKRSVITFTNENSCIDVTENVEKIYDMIYAKSTK